MNAKKLLNNWALILGLTLGFSLFPGFAHAQRIPVVDLADAMRLPIEVHFMDDFRNVKPAKGAFYTYTHLPAPHADWGVLIPQRDQSTNRSNLDFDARVLRGTIMNSVAATLYDKIDQLRRLERFNGPRLKAIALLRAEKGEGQESSYTEVGLVVEHLGGDRIQPRPDMRTAKEENAFLQLFLRMGEDPRKLFPLDYHSENVVGKDNPGQTLVVRPIDVLLVPAAEVAYLKSANPRLYQLRMHQVGYSLLTVEQSLKQGDLRKFGLNRANRCHDLLAHMKLTFPDYQEFGDFIAQQLSLRKPPKPPTRRMQVLSSQPQ